MSRSIARILSRASNEQRLAETARPSPFEEMRRRRFDVDAPAVDDRPAEDYSHLATVYVPSKERIRQVEASQELFAAGEREMYAAATPLPVGAKRHTEPKHIHSPAGRALNGSIPRPKGSAKPKKGGKFSKRQPFTNLNDWINRHY